MQCAEGASPTTESPSQKYTVNSERTNCEERKLMVYYEILNYAYWAAKCSERATVTIKERTNKTRFKNVNKPQVRNDKSSNLRQPSFVS
jgi:hypothetical protein